MKMTGLGYILNDNTASGGVKYEADALGCIHCQALIDKTKWKAGLEGAYCPQCDDAICFPCAARMAKFGCEPTIKKFTDALDDQYRKAQNAKILGI